MELKPPRKKEKCKLRPQLPLPVIVQENGELYKFTGIFDGFSVVVGDTDDMRKLNEMGFFGKGSLSRSYPTFRRKDVSEIIRKRQMSRRKKMWGTSKDTRKVIVVPDSDSEQDNFFTNLRVEYQLDASNVKETLKLCLTEAFFLCNDVKCLDVQTADGTAQNGDMLWTLFCDLDKYFAINYVVYYHFRSKNWVVKPGIKFGGDFLLYKRGPPFYHASYLVVVDILNENCERRKDVQRRSMDMVHISGLNRLCETAGKELLICQVIWPENVQLSSQTICDISINEVVMNRWTLSQEQDSYSNS